MLFKHVAFRCIAIFAATLVIGGCNDDTGNNEKSTDAAIGADTDSGADGALDADTSTHPDTDPDPDADTGPDADHDVEDPGTDVVVDQGIPHQVARRGEAFSLTIPDTAFSDQPLIFSAQVLRRDMSGNVPDVLNDHFWQRSLDHHWLEFSGDTFSGTPTTYDDVQTLQIEVTATAGNGSTASVAFLIVVVDGEGALSAPASTEAECAHVLGEGDSGNIDADALGIEPGDSICIRGGETTGALGFVNVEGTAGQPVYIVNVDGTAYTNGQNHSYTVKITDSNHFRMLGAGSPENPYGWAIQGDTGPGVQIKQVYNDFEVAWVEIHDTSFAGLSMKNDGEQRPEGDMYDVRAHDVYVHNTGTAAQSVVADNGESVYCGIGSWDDGTHSIHRLRVHHIIAHDIAWDAIQIKNNDDENSIVERNFIRGYGVGSAGNTGAHDEGLFAGEGATGIFRYNWVEDAFGPSSHGIQFMGAATTLFHHNVIVNLATNSEGAYAIYGARKGTVSNPENHSVRFVHNTFAGFTGHNHNALIRVFSDLGTQEAANNLFVDAGSTDINIDDIGGNVHTDAYTVFSDVDTRDLRPAGGSAALGAGVSDSDVERDILGQPIPATGIASGAFQAP